MRKLPYPKLRLPLAALCLLAAASPALALNINLTFNLSGSSSVSDFGVNTNSFTGAVAAAAQQLDNLITDPITINITVNGSSGTSAFGSSHTNFAPSYYTYSQVLTALTANASNPAQQIAVANLPAIDPSPGGPNSYAVPSGEAKALGLISGSGTASDGSVTFGALNPWAFNPNNRAVPGQYDFIGVAQHELTEAMGRIWGLGGNFGNGGPDYIPFDLFRYDGGTTTRNMTNNANVWFSINGGFTDLNSFNYAFTSSSGTDTEDPTDWGIGVSNSSFKNSLTNDSFNAYSHSGVVNVLSSADLTVMNVMGYHLSAAAMSGGTWAHDGGGSWATASFWTYPVVPTGGTATVYFAGVPTNPTSPITVTLDGNQSAGSIFFNATNGNGYTLAKGTGGTLSLGTPSGAAINVLAGNHTISAPVALQGPLAVNVDAGSLHLSGPLGEANAGTSITFNGPDTLIYSAAGTFTGNTNVNGGTLQVTGGLLPAYDEYVGGAGGASATVALSAGINAVSNSLTVGANAGGSGIYVLSAGSLSAPSETIGNAGSGSFVQSGGTNSASSSVVISNSGAGTYAMNGGLLTTGEVEVGIIGPTGGGTFTQTNGTVHAGTGAQAGLVLDSSPGYPVATYSLSGGQLTGIAEFLGYDGIGSFIQSGGTHSVSSGMVVGGQTNLSSGTYNLQGGRLSADAETVGNKATGSFVQSGGSNMVSSQLFLGNAVGSSGSYTLGGNGYLSTAFEITGNSASGSFRQVGGTHVAGGGMILGENPGSFGVYTLSGGSLLSQAGISVGYAGTGSIIQSGGTNSLSGGTLTVGVFGTGSYNLQSNGLLSAPTEILGWTSTGSFTQSGGTNSTAALYLGDAAFTFTGSGSYNLSGNGLLAANTEIVGYYGIGSFSQSGGINSSPSSILWLGYNAGSNGTYNLSNNGWLSASLEIVGLFGSGSFTQSGGTHSVSTLYVGDDPGGSGSYNLSGSGQLSVGSLIVGNSADGSFTQTGGTNTVYSSLVLADYSGSSGTYSLNGGLLSLAGLSQGGGNAKFNFGGGTLQVYDGTGFSTNVPILLTTLGSNGTFDTNGSTLTLNGALSGPGGLVKIGAGQLALATGNSYGGPTALYAGVLVAANGAALSATSTGTVTLNGGTLAASAAGGTITGLVQAGSGAHTIGPGAALASGYGILNLNGGLTINNYTRLQFNLNLNTVLGTGSNGDSIYGGDLINLNGSALTVNSVGGIGGVIALAANPLQPGDYRLFHNAGGSPNLSALITPPAGAEVYSLSTSVDAGYIDLVAAANVSASGGTWTHNGNGSWTVGGNWSSNPAIPGGGTVAFPDVNAVAPVTVSLNGNQSAGALVFSVSTANGYTLAQGSGGALSLGTSSGGSITVLRGAHTISAPVVLAGDLAVSTSSGTSLTLSGGLYESKAGSALTLSGAGQVILSGPGSFTGNTTIIGGTLQITPGGQLPATFEYVSNGSGAVSVVQTGGSNMASKEIYFGYFSDASGTLSGGQISAPIEYVGFGGNGTFVQTGGTNSASTNFTVADGEVQGSYTLGGSGLLTATNETFGWNGHANFTQNGGANLVSFNLTIGTNNIAYGNYFLNSGNLSAFSETIGNSGNGDVLQSGGNNTVAWEIDMGYNSSSTTSLYSLSGGSLSAPLEYIGYNGTAFFYQNGGTNAVASTQTTPILDLGYQAGGSGSYTLTGSGLLSVGFSEYIGDIGGGSFTQSGGTHSVSGFLILGNNAGASGNFLLSSGQLSVGQNELIGDNGGGGFTQSGGNHVVSGILILGNNAGSSGSYVLQAGNLSANAEWVGLSGNGSFSQSGGINATTILFLGLNGGSGTYSLSGNGQLSATYEYIGAASTTDMVSGTGSFTQTGGTNFAGSLNLANGDGYSGTYNLNGGLLNLTALNQGSGAATFNFSGGTFQAAAPLATYVPIVLAIAGSNGAFDTNGNALTLNGPLSGPGGLIVVGSGTLSLGVSNSFTGTTLVSNGTLALANSNALSGSTFDASGTGAVVFQSGIGGFAFGGLQGSGSLLMTDALGNDLALTVGENYFDTTFSGSLSDSNSSGSLIKVGTGTLTLSGTNSYLGGTTVADGTLVVTISEGLADGSSLTVGDPSIFQAPVVPSRAESSATAAVPEPGTLALIVAGVASLAGSRGRKVVRILCGGKRG